MSDFIFIFMLWVCVTWICVCYFHTLSQFNLQLSFIIYSGWLAAVCQRSAVLLWLQLWGQTPLIWENWIWEETTCRTQEWRSCLIYSRVQPVDWRLWGQSMLESVHAAFISTLLNTVSITGQIQGLCYQAGSVVIRLTSGLVSSVLRSSSTS